MRIHSIIRIPLLLATLAILRPLSLQAQTFSYDTAGRLTAVVYADGHGVQYTYDDAGNITGIIPISAPSAASDVTASPVNSTSVQVSWTDNATGETGYVVQRRSADSDTWQTVATLATGSVGYLDQGLTSSQQYFYRIQAAGATNNSAWSSAAATPATGLTSPSTLANISTRALVGTQQNVLIAGFVVSGTSPRQVLIRGVGPTLNTISSQLSGVLQDPTLTIYNQNGGHPVEIGYNDNWGTATNLADLKTAILKTGAFPFADGSKDSAILMTLNPGVYTAIVAGAGQTTGIALAEVYDVDLGDAGARLTNISGRADVGVGGNVAIAGFVIGGTKPKTVLVRAVGPSLASQGVSNYLADPKLTIYKGQNAIASNDNWGDDSSATAQIQTITSEVGATPLAAGSKDSAIVITLDPGVYTAIASGVNQTTGVALVEVYDVP